MRVGLVGTGELGSAIGRNLLRAGHALTVFDADAARMAGLTGAGARAAASPAVLAASVEVVVTALPTPAVVEDVLLGSGGVLAAMAPGSTWIDHGTSGRELMLRIEAMARARGIAVIEAPVTGGIPLAHEGRITVLVGAESGVLEAHRGMLEAVGSPVLHLGPVGSASIVKVITNMLAFVHLWALGEGLMLGTAAGLQTGAVFEAIRASCGNSFVAETEGPPILDGSYDYGFTLELAAKDMALAMDLAARHGVPLEMGALVQQILRRGVARYGMRFWSTGIVRLLEDDMGIALRAAGYAPEQRWLPCAPAASPPGGTTAPSVP